jgi:hypothetical protein
LKLVKLFKNLFPSAHVARQKQTTRKESLWAQISQSGATENMYELYLTEGADLAYCSLITSALKMDEKASPNVDNHLIAFKLSKHFDVRQVFLLPFCAKLFFQVPYHLMCICKLQM